MSASTSTPREDDQGTFVGGSFGPDDEGRFGQEGDERLFAAGQGPTAEAEDVGSADLGSEDVEGTESTSDVEGTGDGVPPGERNAPV
ncbi:MAG: hypothetical protein DCC50_03900 [Acidobacteria bacterium]|nr:MAG: hypothetical protein DCC50_03900 [Acidobacteriota bacterium]